MSVTTSQFRNGYACEHSEYGKGVFLRDYMGAACVFFIHEGQTCETYDLDGWQRLASRQGYQVVACRLTSHRSRHDLAGAVHVAGFDYPFDLLA